MGNMPSGTVDCWRVAIIFLRSKNFKCFKMTRGGIKIVGGWGFFNEFHRLGGTVVSATKSCKHSQHSNVYEQVMHFRIGRLPFSSSRIVIWSFSLVWFKLAERNVSRNQQVVKSTQMEHAQLELMGRCSSIRFVTEFFEEIPRNWHGLIQSQVFDG